MKTEGEPRQKGKREQQPDLSMLTARERVLWDKMQHGGWWRMHSMPGHRKIYRELKTRIERGEKKDESR